MTLSLHPLNIERYLPGVKPTPGDLATFRRYVKQDASGCWLWTGDADRDGYPTARMSNRNVRVHRWSLEAHKGAPSDLDMQAGHVCHDRAVEAGTCSSDLDYCQHRRCVNPAHLEWQTRSQNVLAQDHANRRKDVCPRGHDMRDPSNVHVRPSGRRNCRRCDADRKARGRTAQS